MSDLVDDIEKIFNRSRHNQIHFGLLEDGIFYIMHSQICVDTTPDLRECDYSIAMDNGFGHPMGENALYHLYILEGKLVGEW